MSKTKLLSMALALAACFFQVTTSTGEETQRWSVHFTDDVAVLRVSKNTEYQFVSATITSLQNSGTEKFALCVSQPNTKKDTAKPAFSIHIDQGVAEIQTASDLPHKVLVSLLDQLKDAGITKFKFVAAQDSGGKPASQQ